MATRQYIGARYVPKFYQNSVDGSAQWESNVVYEPLTFVTLTNSHMYISKKQVPATIGSPVSNIEYWLDVGSYNGFIEQLQDEIDNINDVTIPAIQSDVALKQNITDNNLETTSKTVVGAVNELNTATQTHGSSIQTLTGEIGDLTELETTDKTSVVNAINEALGSSGSNYSNAVIIGNSYALGVGSDDNYGIFHFLKERYKNAYLFYGAGTAFTDYDGSHTNDTYITHLNDAIADTSFDNSDISEIVIIGAYGDSRQYIQSGRDEATFRSAVQTAVSNFATIARTNFSNLKKITYVDCESRYTNIVTSGGYTSFFSDSINADIALEYLLNDNDIINLGSVGAYIAFKNGMFTNDNYHCTTLGYKTLTDAIIRRMDGNVREPLLRANLYIDISPLTGITNSTANANSYILNGIPHLDILYISIPAGTTTPALSYVKCPIDSQYYVGVIDKISSVTRTTPIEIDGVVYSLNIRSYNDTTGQGIECRFVKATAQTFAETKIGSIATRL